MTSFDSFSWKPDLIVKEWPRPFKLNKKVSNRHGKRRNKAKSLPVHKQKYIWLWRTLKLLKEDKARRATSVVVQPMTTNLCALPVLKFDYPQWLRSPYPHY